MKRDASKEHNSGKNDPTRLAARMDKGLYLRRELNKNKRLDLIIK